MNISLFDFFIGAGASIVATLAVATVIVLWKPLRFRLLLSRYRSLLAEHAAFQDPLGSGLEYYPYHTLEFDQVVNPAEPLVLVIGDAGVGKTSFLKHLLHTKALLSHSRLGFASSTPIVLDENVLKSAGTGAPHARFHRLVRAALSNCAPFYCLDIDVFAKPIDSMVRRHRIIFIVDDIDHFQEAALTALQEILHYTLTATKHRLVIACRTPYYRYILNRRWHHAGIDRHSVAIELRRMATDEQRTRAAGVVARLRDSGFDEAADRMPSLLEHPQLSALCLQPIYFSILIWLLRNGAALDPTIADPFDLIDRAAEILLRTDDQPVHRTVLYAVLGWLAANRIDGFLNPGAELQRDIGKALDHHALGHHQQHIVEIERAICNGILTPEQLSVGRSNTLRFLHPLFRDYVLAWHCKDHPQELLSTFTGNAEGNLDLVYFWSRISDYNSISVFGRWTLQGDRASPVLAATVLKALSSHDATPPISALVASLSDHASSFVNVDTYDPLVAAPFVHWCAARFTAGAVRSFALLRDLCFRLFLEQTLYLEQTSKGGQRRRNVSEQAYHLFGCLVRNLNETTASMIVPLLLRFPPLRSVCNIAATLIATALEREVSSWESSVGVRVFLELDGVPVVKASLGDLLQTLAQLNTPQGFAVLCRQLWVEDRKFLVARACAPHFRPTDSVRAGFSIEVPGIHSQTSFGWLWRPFLDTEPSLELSVNTTRLVSLVAQDLRIGPERIYNFVGELWLGYRSDRTWSGTVRRSARSIRFELLYHSAWEDSARSARRGIS